MPAADLSKSFDVAVRHLFRHLFDGDSLRKNPIVKRAWENKSDARPAADDIVMAGIHLDILRIARLYAAEALESRAQASAHRQLAIVDNILKRKSADAIARELCISIPQFYRDRNAICRRIAKELLKSKHSAICSAYLYEPFRVMLARTSALVDQGLADKAASELWKVASTVTSTPAKAVTFFELADAYLAVGNTNDAVEALRRAKELGGAAEALEFEEFARFGAAVEFKVLMRLGDNAGAKSTMALLRDGGPLGPPRINERELYVQHERCQFSGFSGNQDGANDAMKTASSIARRLQLSAVSRTLLALMELYCAEFVTVGEELRCLGDLLTLGLALGSMRGTLHATVELAYNAAARGDLERMQAYGERALTLVRGMEGKYALLFVVGKLAAAFQQTSHWPMIEGLLFEVESATIPGSSTWIRLKGFQANSLARHGQYDEALDLLYRAQSGASRLGDRTAIAQIQHDLALLLYRAGRVKDATEAIHNALSLAKHSSVVEIMLQTAEILGRPPP